MAQGEIVHLNGQGVAKEIAAAQASRMSCHCFRANEQGRCIRKIDAWRSIAVAAGLAAAFGHNCARLLC